jgi:mannosyl-3-phosphoglycerate phosphatase
MNNMKIIFTDLDGTLLDHDTYSFAAANQTIHLLKKQNIPLIFCTSKTMKESCYWQNKIDNKHPFIVENGGGIYIPKQYFPFSFEFNKKDSSYFIIQLGASLSLLKRTMNKLLTLFDISSFLTMTVDEIMKVTGLPKDQAKLASQREFDIPFIINDETQLKEISKMIHNHHLCITKGGRFYHLTGNNDKGKAISLTTQLYKKQYGSIITIGIGDSENDFSMLNNVDKAYLVKKKDGSYASNNFLHVNGIGPIGWKKIINKEFGFDQ